MGCTNFNKVKFLHAIESICRQIFKLSTIKLAFRQAGLVPYNPQIVLNSIREARPTTPPPSAAL